MYKLLFSLIVEPSLPSKESFFPSKESTKDPFFQKYFLECYRFKMEPFALQRTLVFQKGFF
jgi:hypothetical protein